ncbi:TerB N-terminal domain-containing protein [Proteocatella sphenisci]|uniref:TerB N-terminal domain-containing protein n=1 Tax=Proteocatella sphenisci TaxID=181070 RepID=UPI00048B8178|nr:TerB N-terminal domain-containing protein [Proteocatella sphenisci]
MGLFSKLFKSNENKNTIENSLISVNKEVEFNALTTLSVHSDLEDLIWIADGPKRNYLPDNKNDKFVIDGFEISFNFMSKEPSLIYSSLPINTNVDISKVDRPPYYPNYSELSKEQRGVYWKLLENPYDSRIDIGYVFILYYGLERHLFSGDYKKAFDVILKLRDVHKNNSFQNYSGNALILTCLYRQNVDLVQMFINSLDRDHEYNFSDNLFLLCNYSLNIPLYAKDIMRMHKSFEFTKNNYIKNYSEIFEETLTSNIYKEYTAENLEIDRFIKDKEFYKLRKEGTHIFANTSLFNETIEVPLLTENFKFKKAVYDLLDETHEDVKEKLVQLRKTGKLEKKKESKKEVIVPSFDYTKERFLIDQMDKNKSNGYEVHFDYNQLLDFYYKYRNLDEKYLEKCIYYCLEDINNLDKLQKSYINSRRKEIKMLRGIYSESQIEKEINEIGKFDCVIPAFKRLSIIYEKRNEIQKSIEICERAIEYYSGLSMDVQSSEFEKRKDKLLKNTK